MFFRWNAQSDTGGGVTVLVLVMLLVFVIIFGSLMTYIARQSNLTVNQGQEEQSFGLADTGVQYVVWLLSTDNNPSGPDGGGKTPQELCDTTVEPPPDPDLANLLANHSVEDEGQTIGSFTVEVLSADAASVQVRSTGRDVDRPDICQVVEATVRQTADDLFHVLNWNHLPGYACDTPAPPCVYN